MAATASAWGRPRQPDASQSGAWQSDGGDRRRLG